jgi:hypothetical protein
MNVFENLLDELKEEHLIEDSSIGHGTSDSKPKVIDVEMLEPAELEAETVLETQRILEQTYDGSQDEILETERFLRSLESSADKSFEISDELAIAPNKEVNLLEIENTQEIPHESGDPIHNEPINLQPKQKLSGFELFRKRAMEEVSALQMADNIFSSVEREQMKVIAKPYDDIRVKQVLHSFVQSAEEFTPSQQAAAEFELRQEAETWYSALTARDENISVENLRYCCENTRPPLSPPALLALARFYRNAQYCELVRNKYDLIITRLFSRDIEHNRRELAFTREELVGHLKELYAEWESIPFYSTDDDERISMTVLRFQDLISEAKQARKFDDLIKSDFFNRVRALKRGTAEEFYAPQIAAISIICNVEIGNRYLELLSEEQENLSNASIEEKYGFLLDKSISDTTNKSLQLAQILSQPRAKTRLIDLGVIDPNHLSKKKKKGRELFPFLKLNWLGGVNKWILALTIFSVAGTAGIFLWVEVFSSPVKIVDDVKTMGMENTPFKEYIESARMNNGTLFAISTPSWEKLPREKKTELLTKILADGSNKGYDKVHLFDQNSVTIGFATENQVEVK